MKIASLASSNATHLTTILQRGDNLQVVKCNKLSHQSEEEDKTRSLILQLKITKLSDKMTSA